MWIPSLGLTVLLALGSALPDRVRAKSPRSSSMNEWMLNGMQGGDATPVLCTLGGKPVRGFRRIERVSGPQERQPPEGVIHFVDLEVDRASRCFTEFAGPGPTRGRLAVVPPEVPEGTMGARPKRTTEVQPLPSRTDNRGMSQHKTPPIFSTCEDDPSQSDAIDRFVIGLAEKVDRLQDAELEDDLQQLRTLVTTLGDRAEALGYHPLARVTAQVARACDDEKFDEVRAAMVELTGISGRIRRGHRGAA